MANPAKVKMLEQLTEKFKESENFIVTDFRGLNVDQITDLRGKLYEKSVTYKVVKNNLAQMALQKMGVEEASDYFTGPTAVAFIGDDAPGAAKQIVDFEKNTSLTIKAGYIDGQVFDMDGVIAISKLPDRETLLSQIAGGMVTVLSNFAGVTRNVVAEMALCLKALEDKQQ